jgi:hypothetical protein
MTQTDMAFVEIALNRKQIETMLGWSTRKFFYYKDQLLDAGVIFYRIEGRPPVRRIYGFPSRIHLYVYSRTKQGLPI